MTESLKPTAYPAHLAWRLLALIYDIFPALVIWMLLSAAALLINPGHDHFAAWSVGQWLLYVACWAGTGLYAVESWARGGQTMGMRPWRLRVVQSDGSPAKRKALWKRYSIVSFTAGLAMLWCLIDKERRGLHDILSDTALVRIEPKR
jgi:uncharacterized RDD family membrane protein YckC